jgi:hypothetical protein
MFKSRIIREGKSEALTEFRYSMASSPLLAQIRSAGVPHSSKDRLKK